jgi:hypothetical protein
MAIGKRITDKLSGNVDKILHRKLKIEKHETL